MFFKQSFLVFFIFICISVIHMVNGQLAYGGCPKIETVKSFNVEKFLGVWYEQERYFNLFQLGASCVFYDFEMNGNSSISINNTEYNVITGRHSYLFGLARFEGDENVAKLVVDFPFIGSIEEDFYVIDTDYINYAVLWSCNDLYFTRTEYAWLLTREQFPKVEEILEIKDNIEKMNIQTSKFEATDQTRCYFKM